MLNLFVEFGVQPFDMKTLPNFKLREGLSIINNFETGGITTVSAMPRTTEMSKNVGIFVPKKMLIKNAYWFHQYNEKISSIINK